MKNSFAAAITLLSLLSTSSNAVAQDADTLRANGAIHSDLSLRAGLIAGAINSQVMAGAYLATTIGKSRIDLNIGEEITTTPSLNFVDNLPDPVPSFKRISLSYGREIFSGIASVVLAAGPEYAWGIADGKYLHTAKSPNGIGFGTDYYETNPFSRLGLSLDANVDIPISRHFAFGLRSSLTIDGVETYGLLGMTFGYVFD